MPADTPLPQFDDVLDAAARIAPHARATPVLHAAALDALAGCGLAFKAECLQRAGAFKFRGACNAVFSLDDDAAAGGVVTHSSGNHGAALATAARLRGIPCHVVAPEGAVRSKLALIAAQGAILHRCEATIAAREAVCAQVQQASGALLVHPYTHPRVIAGQGTAALELLGEAADLDVVVVPVGGGGLASGTAIALAGCAPHVELVLAEPAGAADTLQSLQRGERVRELVPETVCDGLRGLLGEPNFRILRDHGAQVLAIDDDATVAAMRLVLEHFKLLVEPSSAIALAAVLAHPRRFAGRRVGIILSGGNVDPDRLPWVDR
ncbi:pyridoxal-phosphate dependent enzyme [Luteimonas saliphila]|uniref:pyridoxal-phosphate dependent enzyme n=1 Tax=Luteimonas saliphila TaxID=2804919 RepID=UPI00192D8FBB|nr:pyridoxal-phosphate dependent enzyme [Luteimonas saliphila]